MVSFLAHNFHSSAAEDVLLMLAFVICGLTNSLDCANLWRRHRFGCSTRFIRIGYILLSTSPWVHRIAWSSRVL